VAVFAEGMRYARQVGGIWLVYKLDRWSFPSFRSVQAVDFIDLEGREARKTSSTQLNVMYHRRSLVETKMRCGEQVMARDFDRQVAELQVRAAILNRFTQLGTPETVRVA